MRREEENEDHLGMEERKRHICQGIGLLTGIRLDC